MQMNQEQIDGLLVKYLLGEADGEEALTIQQWVDASAANKKHFEDFRTIWDTSKQLEVKSEVDEHQAWAKFMQMVEADEVAPAAPQPTRRIALGGRQLMAMAAMMVAVLGIGVLVWMMGGKDELETIATTGQAISAQLPDGTVVALNKHSSLTYHKNFNGKTRDVTLKGEGFFNVTPNKQRPFVITTGESRVTVVGTSFNVRTTPESTDVIVETGIVEVAKHQNSVRVLPHQKAHVDRQSEQPVVETNEDKLYNYYRTNEFVCNGTPLWKLVEVLNEAYGAQITIANPAIRNLQLTTTFREEPIDSILPVIAQTLNIQLEQEGDRIILK